MCPVCGSHVAVSLRACPGCGRLVHAERLKSLADAAAVATNAGDLAEALTHWREAMELLPSDSRQLVLVREKAAALSKRIDEMPMPPRSSPGEKTTSFREDGATADAASVTVSDGRRPVEKSARNSIGAAAVAVALFIVTKGKLLLAGLLKGGTFFSMLASMGLYWTAFGWKFAVGLIVSIYIHEMGHVAMLRRFGVNASAPMFIPGIGAIVRLKQHLATPAEDARVGLAGPMWGLGAAVGAFLVSIATGWPSWRAIAHVGAWVNLFNLLPAWQLDGGRAFNAMTKGQRGWALLTVLVAWAWVQDGILILIAIVAFGRTFSGNAPNHPDSTALWQYVFLIATLSALIKLIPTLEGVGLAA